MSVLVLSSRSCWASMSKYLTSAFNVKFVCMVHVHCMSVCTLWPAQLVTCIICRYCHHVHLLSYPIPSPSMQVCPTVRPLRLSMKELLHFAAYALLPRSCSSHNVLHSPRLMLSAYVSCTLGAFSALFPISSLRLSPHATS